MTIAAAIDIVDLAVYDGILAIYGRPCRLVAMVAAIAVIVFVVYQFIYVYVFWQLMAMAIQPRLVALQLWVDGLQLWPRAVVVIALALATAAAVAIDMVDFVVYDGILAID